MSPKTTPAAPERSWLTDVLHGAWLWPLFSAPRTESVENSLLKFSHKYMAGVSFPLCFTSHTC
jgi:hypothetical protein